MNIQIFALASIEAPLVIGGIGPRVNQSLNRIPDHKIKIKKSKDNTDLNQKKGFNKKIKTFCMYAWTIS